jgi:DNA-binding NarL/FixJ family response regulator
VRYRAMTRLLVADDHDVVRCGLRKIFETQPTWKVVAEAADGEEAVRKALATVPDVAIIDYSMPTLNGAEITRRILPRLPNTEVLIFTMHESEALITEVLRVGARGYLLKSDASGHLIAAVEALASHKPYFAAKVSDALLLRAITAGRRRKAAARTVRKRVESFT